MNHNRVESVLKGLVGSHTPGLQYLALNANGPVFEFNAGLADIRNQIPMHPSTCLAAYSMSKTITAAGVMLLMQEGNLCLDDPIVRYVSSPYDSAITVRQLLTHTSGIPNPIPLRWVHSAPEHASFDEAAALQSVLRKHPKLSSRPGTKYAYSNIGYWLLGEIVSRVAGQKFTHYIAERVLQPLGIASRELSYEMAEGTARGYLEKYSLLNLARGFLIDHALIGGYEGRWLRIDPHGVNGAAFGGLLGSCQGFGAFLQDQLRSRSVLFTDTTRELFYTQQQTAGGSPVPMTLAWHIGESRGVRVFFKEGGGGGFHCMMRVYRDAGIATIIMANATGFDAKTCLDAVDRGFL